MKKLSPSQIRMLRSIREHGSPTYGLRGRSAHGGAEGTLASLRRRGLVTSDCQLTTEGERALAED